MYKKCNISYSTSVPSEDVTCRPFCDDVRISRPLSYFVKGGVDLDGISNRPPLPGSSDSVEDVSSGAVDILADPRSSRSDIVAFASEYANQSEQAFAEKMAE